MGPSLIYSERSNEELEELFQTIVNDKDFLNLCEEEFGKTYFSSASSPSRDEHGEIVHEINMSVYYNVQVDRNNADLTFVQRSINVIPDEQNNRFSNLNLSNDIERCVQMHDFVRRQATEKKPTTTTKKSNSTRRRATIGSLIEETHEFDPASLERIVEQQLEAARRAGSWQHFQPINNNLQRTQTFSQPRFVAPPILQPDFSSRIRVDQIDYPNDAHLRRSRSMRQVNPSPPNDPSRRLSTLEERSKLTTPLKSIRRQMNNRNPTASFNRKVSKGRGETITTTAAARPRDLILAQD